VEQHVRVAFGALIRAAGCFLLAGAEPPADLVRLVAARETESEAVRGDYTYRERISIDELDQRGVIAGRYTETRDVIFLANHERSEQPAGRPHNTLARLKLTAEDFRDLRDIQPLLLTTERLPLYEVRPRGEERIDSIDCWVLQIRPRQILSGQRLFEGLLWADKRDYSIIQTQGRAVPQIVTTKNENLFPNFTTIRKRTETGFWFPALTVSDDTLPFRTGPIRTRMKIEYSNYRRFGSETSIRFEETR
jgi:hypothetical protein